MNEFKFTDCVEVKELLGKQADDERQLMELIEDAPLDSIHFHMHGYFLRHFYILGPYPNDFANWVGIQVRDKVLGEKLASITPWINDDLEDVRNEILDIIDDHLSSIKVIPGVIFGHPFYFMKSSVIEVPTNLKANNLKTFRDALEIVDASAIYNHIFEARFRGKKGKSDFSLWFDHCLGLPELATKLEEIDAYMYSLEGLRLKILDLCNEQIRRM